LKTEYHIPVLLDTMISYLINPNIENHIIVDGTLGGGGYSERILNSIGENSKLICVDKDINAINHSSKRLENKATKILFKQGNFAEIKNIINDLGFSSVTGIVVDLGLSSYQLDHEDGFSFMNDTILDMRADKDSTLTASQILNQYRENELTDIFESYGEIKKAKRLLPSGQELIYLTKKDHDKIAAPAFFFIKEDNNLVSLKGLSIPNNFAIIMANDNGIFFKLSRFGHKNFVPDKKTCQAWGQNDWFLPVLCYKQKTA